MQNTSTKTDSKKAATILASAVARAERDAVADFFKSHGAAVKSVPIKSVAKYGKTYNADCGAKSYEPSPRSCAAVAIAFAASNVAISDGATAPRRFTLAGIPCVIENGCTSDGNGSLFNYNAKTEKLTLRNGAAKLIQQHLTEKAVKAITAQIAKTDLQALVQKAVAK